MNRAVVLLSGGLDSTTLLHYVRQRVGAGVYALTFCYGQLHVREISDARWQAARAVVLEHRVVELEVLSSLIPGASALTDPQIAMPAMADLDAASSRQPSTYVPHRNLILLSLAAAFAEARGVANIYYGAQQQDAYGYWDCTPEFQTRLNAMLALNRGTAVTIHAPFATLRKAELVRMGLELGVDYGHTWTCYRGGTRPCGICPSCAERATAFREAGVPDPLLG
ncbi:MAG: 7-cyano-7-deazaguanine synthase QueC [bacterium]